MSEAAVEIEHISKTYKSGFRRSAVQAVRSLSLSIPRGAVTALVGPNGAGKTTTIYAILGLLTPDEGRISVLGMPPADPDARRRVGYQSEIFYTYPFFTAVRALEFYGKLSGIPRAVVRDRIPTILSRMGLADAADRKVRTFSKGMVQRLGLAQALIHAPEILVLDEPTTGLDPEGRRLVADIILEEKSRGTTVFLSSHILSDVERTCDRMVMIRDGEVILQETIHRLSTESDEWEIDVAAWDPAAWMAAVPALQTTGRSSAQAGAGAATALGPEATVTTVAGGATITCSAARKPAILRALLDRGIDITAVHRRKKSLEDIYMERMGPGHE